MTGGNTEQGGAILLFELDTAFWQLQHSSALPWGGGESGETGMREFPLFEA